MQLDWLVIYTKPQQEKKVSQNLQRIGIDSYCPTTQETRQWSDRKKKVQVPVFKSYVFVRIAPEARNRVFDVPGVVNYLFWLGKPAIVREIEIQNLIDFLNRPDASAKTERLVPGSIFYISDGPFKDSNGTIKLVAKNYVVLAIVQLGMSVRITY